MKRTVLLINPWIHDYAAYDLWCKPLALLAAGTWLRQAGVEVRMIDCLDRFHPRLLKEKPEGWITKQSDDFFCGKFCKKKIEPPVQIAHIERNYYQYGLRESLFIDELRSLPRPDLCMISSMMTYWYPGTLRTIEVFKQVYPDVPIAVGGIYPTLHYEHACATLPVDYVHHGPIDHRYARFMTDTLDLAQTPPPFDPLITPAFDLVYNHNSLSVITSIGCPYRCAYCASGYLQPHYKRLDVPEIVRRFENYVDLYDTQHIAFFDDALLYQAQDHIIPLLKEWLKRDRQLYFHTPNGLHARFVTRELAELLFQSGFKTLRLSLETTDAQKQSSTGGKIYSHEMQRSISYLYDAGFKPENVSIYLLIGLPGQTYEEIMTDIHAVHTMGARIDLSAFTPIPHTSVWNNLAYNNSNFTHDPILHNKAIFFLADGNFNMETMRKLRIYVSDLNSRLI